MAILKNSPLEGLLGTLGDIAFRTWNGKTYAYLKSTKPRKLSAAQKKNLDRFREASLKAKQMLQDHQVMMHYQTEALRMSLPNAYTAVMKDLMRKA